MGICLGYYFVGSSHSNDPLSPSYAQCGELPLISGTVTLVKNASSTWNWRWGFEIALKNGSLEMRCPSRNYDLNVEFNNTAIGRTSTPHLVTYDNHTIITMYDVLDCHDKNMYTVRIIDPAATNLCSVSSGCFVMKNEKVIYFIDQPNKTHIILKDFNHTTIAELKYYDLDVEKWVIDIIDPSNPRENLFLLLVIAGKQSFTVDNSYVKTFDTCNELSKAANITGLLLILASIFICVGIFMTNSMKDDKQNTPNSTEMICAVRGFDNSGYQQI